VRGRRQLSAHQKGLSGAARRPGVGAAYPADRGWARGQQVHRPLRRGEIYRSVVPAAEIAAMSAACLRMRSIGMQYGEGAQAVHALKEIDLEIDEHEFVTIVGPSGCGKSTLLYLVAGFLRPTAGTLELRGQPIVGPGPDRGIVFQRYSLFPWLTVRG